MRQGRVEGRLARGEERRALAFSSFFSFLKINFQVEQKLMGREGGMCTSVTYEVSKNTTFSLFQLCSRE